MPVKEKELEKVYFGIGEVAQMLQVNASLIRFWEKQFPGITPLKNKKGDRLFTKKEIEKLREIHKLVKEKGFKLSGAKKQLRTKELKETPSHSVGSIELAKDKLHNAKKMLLDLKSMLD